MRIEIEKKLELENWLSVQDVYKWVCDNHSSDKHLTYSQVDDVVKSWRKSNSITTEAFISNNPNNKTGLPLFRGIMKQYYKKGDKNKLAKVARSRQDSARA